MRIVRFEPYHADHVIAWVRDAEELMNWASLSRSPTRDDFAKWHAEPGVYPHTGVAGDVVVGYGEVWLEDPGEAELGRIVIAPSYRGRGLGKKFVHLLVEAAARRSAECIWIRVVPENAAAIACYEGSGFVRATTEAEARLNDRQPRAYRWLSRQPR